METKKRINITGKQFLLFGAIITILCTFFMFARAVHWSVGSVGSDKNDPSFFQLAFGLYPFELDRRAGFTAIFVFQCIAIISSILAILCYFNILLDEGITPVFSIISSVCSFVIMILSFCSIPLCKGFQGLIAAEATLGFGAILLSLSHIIAIFCNIYGVVRR